MPEMDGYTASKIIRESYNSSKLPIIAMTAHSLQADREKCLNSGMNDFLSKPVNPDQLFSILQKWLKSDVPIKNNLDRDVTQNKAYIMVRDTVPEIDLNDALSRLNGNIDLIVRLLAIFYKDYSGYNIKIKKALENNDFNSAKNLVHSLKGSAGTISAQELHRYSCDLDSYLKQNRKENIKEYLEKFDQAFQKLIESISHLPELKRN